MALRDTWRRALEYFGLVEGDYIDEGDYPMDEPETGSEGLVEEPTAMREPAVSPIRGTSRRAAARRDEIDDIFADEPPRSRRRLREAEPEEVAEPAPRGNGGSDFSMHVVTPRSFNDAQQVADEFKRQKPVIINLQSTDRELSKRLIDFSSGMTYALGGGMQRIAQGIFLLTPANVDVSAEEKARILEGGFFNQS
jgi:cell division inhibitor SepF